MPRRADLRLYLVTDTGQCGPAGVPAVVSAAVDGGVTVVQLRDPHATTRALCELGTALLTLLRPRGVPLVVNDRLDVALAIGADGVHVGQDDLDPRKARTLAPELLVGLSVTSVAEATAAAALPAGTLDYVGAGPVFATLTKATGPPLGLSGLAEVCAALTVPVVAIGGVSTSNAGDVVAAGAAGLCVVSAICAAPDPRAAASALLRAGARA